MESIRRKDNTPSSNRTSKRDEGEQKSHPSQRLSTLRGHSEGKSYFGMLSQGAGENIIRFTSDRPRSADWISHVSAELVLSLLEANSIMARRCRSLFVSLEVFPCNRNEFTSLTVAHNRRLQVERLISSLGEELTELKGVGTGQSGEYWEQWLTVESLKLRRLSFSMSSSSNISLSGILSGHCQTLKFLEIERNSLGETAVGAIAQFGQGLTSLSISIRNSSSAIDIMWKSMGAKLEEMSFTGRINLGPVMKNCKKLRKLRFNWLPSDCHQGLEVLCKGLGKQLTSASFGYCSIDSIRLGRIASSCENVSLNVREIGGCTIAALEAIGARAGVAGIGERIILDSNNIYKSFQLAGEYCENLRSISVSNELSKNLFLALFTHPKPLLVDFKANLEQYHNTHFVFEVLARNTSSIETLDFDGRLSLIHP